MFLNIKSSIIIILLLVATFLLSSLDVTKEPVFVATETTSVAEVLKQLGDTEVRHKPDFSIEGVSEEKGKDIVLKGITKDIKGGKTSKQSQHFVCTSCHNVEKEDPDLSVSDPQARLLYVKEKGLPFLQGTALYGAVNRTSFYNGDYDKKYGDLVVKARNNLREAIQLCAVECSQGRSLKRWEMESVLAYLWTIDLKMGDLNLSDKENTMINQYLADGAENDSSIALLKSKYLQASPATFINPPENRKEGNTYKGNPENGQLIYELSCLHCHDNQRYSFFELANSEDSYDFLAKHFTRYTRYSVYQVGRYGTSPLPGKRAYMPQYPEEKMSREMMEDLRAFLEK